MKKAAVLLVLILVVSVSVEGFTLKSGCSYSYARIGGCNLSAPNFELRLEQKIYKRFGMGIGIRKEGHWGYNGYYLSLYPTYTIREGKNYFIQAIIGAEYGIPSTKFDRYYADYRDWEIISQKWIYLVQNISIPGDKVCGNSGTLYPFASVSYGLKWKRLMIEGGLRLNFVKFGVKKADFLTNNFQDKESLSLIGTLFVQVGIRIF